MIAGEASGGPFSARHPDPPDMESTETRDRGRAAPGGLSARVRSLWAAKLVGIPASMAAFFLAYFLILGHPPSAVTTVPLIGADRWVPFAPWAFLLYASLWVYVTLAPSLLDDRLDLLAHLGAAAAMSAAGFAVFLAWPTRVPSPDIDWSSFPALARLKTVDATGNALPSLHVAFAVFTAACLGRLLRSMGACAPLLCLNWLWCMGIAYSTMAVRQHVALDVITGAALGAAAAVAHAHVLTFLRVRRAIR
jgi:membrane-associated phospholipid phosphatase